MAARLNFEACPQCGEIRNSAGMKSHLKKKHGTKEAANV